MRVSEENVRRILAEVARISSDASSDADLYLELGVASITALQLLMEFEEQFQVKIPDDEFVQASTIAKLTALLDRLES